MAFTDNISPKAIDKSLEPPRKIRPEEAASIISASKIEDNGAMQEDGNFETEFRKITDYHINHLHDGCFNRGNALERGPVAAIIKTDDFWKIIGDGELEKHYFTQLAEKGIESSELIPNNMFGYEADAPLFLMPKYQSNHTKDCICYDLELMNQLRQGINPRVGTGPQVGAATKPKADPN